jgi:hypothetical protein
VNRPWCGICMDWWTEPYCVHHQGPTPDDTDRPWG